MNHPWFAEVTWDRLVKKDIDAPYVPPVRAGAGDASNGRTMKRLTVLAPRGVLRGEQLLTNPTSPVVY